LLKAIEGWERVHKREQEENLLKEIHRVFRDLPQRLPQYDFFPVKAEGQKDLAMALPQGETVEARGEEPGLEEAIAEEKAEEAELSAPGRLAAAAIVPGESEVQFGASRVLRARAFDARGRRIAEGVDFAWSVDTEAVTLEVDPASPARAVVRAPESP